MVLKRGMASRSKTIGFENDVKMYGTQTLIPPRNNNGLFENDVKMYGTQTCPPV